MLFFLKLYINVDIPLTIGITLRIFSTKYFLSTEASCSIISKVITKYTPKPYSYQKMNLLLTFICLRSRFIFWTKICRFHYPVPNQIRYEVSLRFPKQEWNENDFENGTNRFCVKRKLTSYRIWFTNEWKRNDFIPFSKRSASFSEQNEIHLFYPVYTKTIRTVFKSYFFWYFFISIRSGKRFSVNGRLIWYDSVPFSFRNVIV